MIKQPPKELPMQRLPLDNTRNNLDSTVLTPEVNDRIQPKKEIEPIVCDLTNTAFKSLDIQVESFLKNK